MASESFSCSGCCTALSDLKKLICPTCKSLGVVTAASFFCSQECFQKSWKAHKSLHRSNKASAPSISLSNSGIGISGVTVKNDLNLGRVLVAARSFKPGDIVLEESPLIVYRVGWPDLLAKYFDEMSDEDKEKLFDMQHLSKPEDAKFKEFIEPINKNFKYAMSQAPIQQLLQKYNATEELAFKLCTLANINTHMYTGDSEDYHEVYSTQDISKKLSALFYLGSKAAHSCDPNTAYSSKSVLGKLCYYAVKDIEEGDLVTFSYINSINATTAERQQQLKESKDFLCECTKCKNADLLSAFKCSIDGCRGFTMQSPTSSGFEWSCNVCASNAEPNLKFAESVERQFMSIEQQSDNVGVSLDLSRRLVNLLSLAESPVSPYAVFNATMLNMYSQLATYHASSAATFERLNTILSLDYRKQSADITFRQVKAIECLGANCFLGKDCSENHKPYFGVENLVLWGCLDYMKAKHPLPIWVNKYMIFLECSYGVDDVDVNAIRKALVLSQKLA